MNKYYCIVAPAKLNLNLFVTGKNKEGYHLLKSSVCFLELTDKIYIKRHNKDVFYQNTTKYSSVTSIVIFNSLNKKRPPKLDGLSYYRSPVYP